MASNLGIELILNYPVAMPAAETTVVDLGQLVVYPKSQFTGFPNLQTTKEESVQPNCPTLVWAGLWWVLHPFSFMCQVIPMLSPGYLCMLACRIVVTQPRRIAAISVADRVAWERGERAWGLSGPEEGFSGLLEGSEIHLKNG